MKMLHAMPGQRGENKISKLEIERLILNYRSYQKYTLRQNSFICLLPRNFSTFKKRIIAESTLILILNNFGDATGKYLLNRRIYVPIFILYSVLNGFCFDFKFYSFPHIFLS